MKSFIKIIILGLLLSSFVYSQSEEEIRRNLQQLAIKIHTVEALAQKYNHRQASDLVKEARRHFDEAMDLLRQRPPRINHAKMSFYKAKKFVDWAARLLLDKPAIRAKNELDKLMRRAEQAVHQNYSDQARYMLNKARAFQAKAGQAYRSDRFFSAQEYYRISKYFANRSIQIAEGKISASTPFNRFEEALKNLESLYKDVAASPMNNELEKLLQKVRSFFKKARASFNNGNLVQAFSYLQISERLLYRAIDMNESTESGQKENLRSNLISLKLYINEIEKNIGDGNNNIEKKLLRKSNQFYLAAERDFESGDLKNARLKIVLSQRMANKALQYTSNSGGPDDQQVAERIEEVTRLLQLQKQKLGSDMDEISTFMLSQAEELIVQAKEDFEQDRIWSAFQKTQLALRFINRVDYLSETEKKQVSSEDELRNKYNRLLSIATTLQDNSNQKIPTSLPVIIEILKKAEHKINSGRYYIAAELLLLAENQLNRLMKIAVQ